MVGSKESPAEENYKESLTEKNYNNTAQEETLLTEGTHAPETPLSSSVLTLQELQGSKPDKLKYKLQAPQWELVKDLDLGSPHSSHTNWVSCLMQGP
jgi:hypothetical protein